MANSSPPPPRTAAASTPAAARPLSFHLADNPQVSEFLLDVRNSPEAHRRNYEVAQREHRRVLDAALHVYELHQLSEAQREIEEEEKRRKQLVAEEAKRIEIERQAKIKQLEDEARLTAQKAAPLPKPVLPPPPPQPTAPAAVAPAARPAPANGFLQPRAKAPTLQINGEGVPPGAPKPPPQQTAPQQATSQQPAAAPPAPNGQQAAPQANGSAAAKPTPRPQLPAPADDRHIQIHKNLKGLRKFVVQQAAANPALKKRMGDMRRDIRKSFGQLTSGGLKENKIPVARLVTTLLAGLREVPSVPVDPNQFVLEPRNTPVEGALRNEAQLPSLYLYLLNITAKAAISQFINESGADTHTAEAIGQTVAKVFSESEFLWRGKSMIDMLIAKYRVFCPVLFGFHGDDRTEKGRIQVGWRKEDGHWIPEQYHIDRMTGLGAGFAAMTLRDFSRVKAQRPNPWPPMAYWTALARIVNTPPEEMSETQCYVLKAMIADNESRFMSFYGNAAVAALRCALVDYPARKPKATAASETLKVLAKTIVMKTGLDLERI